MCGFQHHRQPGFDRLGNIDHVHLRTRNHDVARRQVSNLENAFDHRQCIGIDQTAFVRIMQNFKEFRAIFRFGSNQGSQPFEQ